jgi:hypothetical protein
MTCPRPVAIRAPDAHLKVYPALAIFREADTDRASAIPPGQPHAIALCRKQLIYGVPFVVPGGELLGRELKPEMLIVFSLPARIRPLSKNARLVALFVPGGLEACELVRCGTRARFRRSRGNWLVSLSFNVL